MAATTGRTPRAARAASASLDPEDVGVGVGVGGWGDMPQLLTSGSQHLAPHEWVDEHKHGC